MILKKSCEECVDEIACVCGKKICFINENRKSCGRIGHYSTPYGAICPACYKKGAGEIEKRRKVI